MNKQDKNFREVTVNSMKIEKWNIPDPGPVQFINNDGSIQEVDVKKSKMIKAKHTLPQPKHSLPAPKKTTPVKHLKKSVDDLIGVIERKSLPFHSTREDAEDLWSGKYGGTKKPVVKVRVPKGKGYIQAREPGDYYTARHIAERENLEIVPENMQKGKPLSREKYAEMRERQEARRIVAKDPRTLTYHEKKVLGVKKSESNPLRQKALESVQKQTVGGEKLIPFDSPEGQKILREQAKKENKEIAEYEHQRAEARKKAFSSVQKAISLTEQQIEKSKKAEKGIIGTGAGAGIGAALAGPVGAALGGIGGGVLEDTVRGGMGGEEKSEKSKKMKKSYSKEDIAKSLEIIGDIINDVDDEELKKQWQRVVLPAAGGYIGSKLAQKRKSQDNFEQKAVAEPIESKMSPKPRKSTTDSGGQSEINNPTTADVSSFSPSETVKTG